MNDLILSLAARADLQDMLEYGLETWGRPRSWNYFEGLYDVFDKLMRNPGLGRQRPEYNGLLRSFRYVSHVIFYMPAAKGLLIARVLHGSMDHAKQFEDYDPLVDLPAD